MMKCFSKDLMDNWRRGVGKSPTSFIQSTCVDISEGQGAVMSLREWLQSLDNGVHLINPQPTSSDEAIMLLLTVFAK